MERELANLKEFPACVLLGAPSPSRDTPSSSILISFFRSVHSSAMNYFVFPFQWEMLSRTDRLLQAYLFSIVPTGPLAPPARVSGKSNSCHLLALLLYSETFILVATSVATQPPGQTEGLRCHITLELSRLMPLRVGQTLAFSRQRG